jgi:cysteine-rich repeat protein
MDPFALKFDRFGSLFVDYTPILPSSTLVKDFVLDASTASDSSLLFAIQQPDTTYFVSLSPSGSVDSTAFGGTPLNLPVTLHGVSSRFSATSLGTVVVTTHKTIKGHADGVSFLSSTTTRIAIARSSDFPPLLPPSMSAVALSRSSSNFYVLGNAFVNISESTPAVYALDLQSPTSGSLILSTGPRNTTQSVSISLFVNPTQAFYLAQRRLRDGRAELVIERHLSSGILDMEFSQNGTLTTMKAIISMKMTNADARPDGEVFCAGGTYAGLLWIAVFNSSGQLKISYEATLDRDLSLSSIQAVERYSSGFFVLVTAENDTSSILVVLNSNLLIVDQVVFANSQLGCMVLVPDLGYLYLAGTARPAEGTSAVYRLFFSNFSTDPSWSTGLSLGNDSTVELSSLWWDPRRFRLVGMGSASTINTISRVFFVTIHPMTSQIDCSHIYRGGLRRLFPVEDGLIETASIPGAYASLLRSSISSAIRVVGENALDQCVAECGDGVADLSEECDDGNQRSGDGCSSFCRVEVGWSCVHEGIGCRPKVQAG